MHRTIVFFAVLALTLTVLASPASADKPDSSLVLRGWEPPVDPPPPTLQRSKNTRGLPIQPTSHDPFKVNGAVSGATITQGPHGNSLSLDYKNTSGADTLVWSNNKGLTGTAAQLGGTYSLYTTSDAGCPNSTTNFAQFSHNEYAVRITVSFTDGVGNLWTITNDYWHMGSISTGTKTSGSSFGTQATHPIGGCKYYYAPGQGYHGQLASTGAHIHHTGWNANTYESSPIKFAWTGPSH